MRNYFWALLGLITITIVACTKINSDDSGNKNADISIANAVAIKMGVLNFSNKNLTGSVTIYQNNNGAYILAFQQMQFTSSTDVDVKLAKTENTNDGGIKLFSVKSITDHLYFEIPSSIDINNFNYLYLQSDIAETPVGSTWLK